LLGAPAAVVAQDGAPPDGAGQEAAPLDVAAQEGAPPDVAGQEAAPPVPVVQTLGDGDQKLFVVDHDGAWSMHAENIVTGELFRLWHQGGGPDVVTKTPLDRPYTMSVHRLPSERVVARLLEGYGYTLHYDATGRLERVRVYSPEPSQIYKTPRLVESLARWRELETTTPSSPAQPAPQPGA
jgi:hypothetical protein